MEQFLRAETLIIELLLVASIVAIVVRRFRIPYTVALVVVGLLFTLQTTEFSLTPELILVIFVPPLIFEAAFHVDLESLRRNWRLVGALAVPGVLLAMAVVGGIVAFGVGLPLPVAFLFGALMAATDPVAVVAVFRSLGAPHGLSTLVEGESLFNDGTAIVIFNIMLAIVVSGEFSLFNGFIEFLVVAVGGLAVGVALGWLASRVIAAVDDYLIETMLTTVLAFGSYLVAERLHVSGVLAVVAAGVLSGNLGPRGMSPTTKIVLFNFWENLAFVANSVIFLLIGLDIDPPQLAASAGPIGVAVVAVIIARLLVYAIAWLHDPTGRRVPMAWRHVMFWGGLRGAISLALVLSLPVAVQERDLLRVMAFGVILFTLLVQGTTMQFLLSRLGLVHHTEEQLSYQRTRARLLAVRTALESIRALYREAKIGRNVWEEMGPRLEREEAALETDLRELVQGHPELAAAELVSARREGLRAQRSVIDTLFRDGMISEEVYEELVTQVDAELASEDPRLIGRQLEEDGIEVKAQASAS